MVCRAHGMSVEAFYGGCSYSFQERSLRKGLHILVATPGRCLDHISRGTLDLSNVQTIVLDEGDTMLEMGFQTDVENIMANVKTPGEDANESHRVLILTIAIAMTITMMLMIIMMMVQIMTICKMLQTITYHHYLNQTRETFKRYY